MILNPTVGTYRDMMVQEDKVLKARRTSRLQMIV